MALPCLCAVSATLAAFVMESLMPSALVNLRRLFAVGSLATLGAMLGGCVALPDDPYAVGPSSGIYDRGGIYSGGAVYAPSTLYPQAYPAYPAYPSAVPVYPAYPSYQRSDDRWRRIQEQQERDAWRERERTQDQRRQWQQRHEDARQQREREQARQNDWQQRRDQWLRQQQQQNQQQGVLQQQQQQQWQQQQERERQVRDQIREQRREQQREQRGMPEPGGLLRGRLGGGTEKELGH